MERVKSLTCWDGKDITIRSVGELTEELQLGEGRTNQNFIVDAPKGRFFVRIGADLPYFGVARAREHAAARAASESGIGAAVIHTEAPDALVQAFVAGRAMTEADLHAAASAGPSDPLLVKLTTAIRKLHATPVPTELAKMKDEYKGIDTWGGPHMAKWLAYAESCGFKREPLLTGVRELVAKVEKAAGPLTKQTPAKFCHFDLLCDNFVITGSGDIMIVDFEYAAPGQPLMDLAVLAMGCSLEPLEEKNLLSSYLNADVSEAQIYRFKAMKLLAALRESLWATTAELSGSSALPLEEAQAYFDKNYAKFKQLREEFESLPMPKSESQPLRKAKFSKVSKIAPDSKGVNVMVRCVKGPSAAEGNDSLKEVVLGDDSGVVTVSLRADAAEALAACVAGASLRVQNAHVRMVKGRIRLVIDKWAVLKTADEKLSFDPKLDKDISATEYELA